MSILTKDAILSAQDRTTKDIEIPEWGGTVRLSVISATDRDAWEQQVYGGDKPNVSDFRARFVALCLVDEQGARMFTDKEVAQLGSKSATALSRVFKAAQKLNALSDDEVEAAEKN